MPVQKGSYEQRVPGAAEKRDTKNEPRRDTGAVILSQIRHCETGRPVRGHLFIAA
jgi:hypothetical protein